MSSISFTLALRSQALLKTLESGVTPPATAIQERDGDYILDRSGNYIEVRA